MTKPFTIYVSGDAGSKSLRGMFSKLRVPFVTRDIRKRDVLGKRTDLLTLQNLQLRTVPQVFKPDGSLLGDFDSAARYLKTLPKHAPTLAVA